MDQHFENSLNKRNHVSHGPSLGLSFISSNNYLNSYKIVRVTTSVRVDQWRPFGLVRDWSLITGRVRTKWENRQSETFCPPPPQDRVKPCGPPPPFKEWKLFAPPPPPPVKTTSKLCVPPPLFSMAKTFPPPPPNAFRRGKLHVRPLPFCSPTLPIISDQSLMSLKQDFNGNTLQ